MVQGFRGNERQHSERYSTTALRCLLAFVVSLGLMHGRAAAQPATASEYRIAAGDKIGITVFGQPDLSDEPTVDQNGNIRLSLIGDIHAAKRSLAELERSIEEALAKGYVKRPKVTAKITAYRPIHVLGMVRTPGLYPYEHGQSVFAAVMRAGGMGTAEHSGQGGGGDFFQADDRVRLLEISHASLLAKKARLVAQANRVTRIEFADTSASPVDQALLADMRESEERAFAAERRAEENEVEALRQQVPRLEAEIASLRRQSDLELRQRDPSYNVGRLASEVRREETRVDLNSTRLKSDALKAELAVGELQFKIAELHNSYQRRALADLRETERELLEMSVNLPSARRARAARAGQMGWLTTEHDQMPEITVIRSASTTTVKYEDSIRFLLLPGDVVQVGSILPPASHPPSTPSNQVSAIGQPNR
jgi:polysaccharide export outer membrane protein